MCCSKEIPKSENTNRIVTNLNVFFLLKTLLQVPNNQLETNFKDVGNPEDWVRLCNQCSHLTEQANKLYCKIVKAEIELKSVRKLIVEKIKSSHIGLISGDNGGNVYESRLVKNQDSEKYGKRQTIWESTREFTTTCKKNI